MNPIARRGDLVFCPHHQAHAAVIDGDESVIVEGEMAATIGSRFVCCGAEGTLDGSAPGAFIGRRAIARTRDTHDHGGVVVGGASTMFVGNEVLPSMSDLTPVPDATLDTRYFLDRLIALAKHLREEDFIPYMAVAFGADVPRQVMKTLRDMLVAGSIRPAEVVVVRGGRGFKTGMFEGKTRRILIAQSLARQATHDAQARDRLFLVLLHETGHFIDKLIRADLAPRGSCATDAPLEEGSSYTFALVDIDVEHKDRTVYATYSEAGQSTQLAIDYAALRARLASVPPSQRTFLDVNAGAFEHFSASNEQPGCGVWSHERIQQVVEKAGFSADEAEVVENGNWCRDLAQVVHPLALGATKAVSGRLTRWTRDGLTEVVNVYAQHKFAIDPNTPRGRRLRVTRDHLGVANSWEHCDDPHGTTDARAIDPDFRGAWEPWEGEILPARWARRCIVDTPRTPRGKSETRSALEYVETTLRMAVNLGRGDAGLFLLGEALHCIQDLMSHTNIVELSIRRAGIDVPCWTRALRGVEGPTTEYPLVSGTYGMSDAAVSTLYMLGSHVDRGVRSADAVQRRLAIDLMEAWLRARPLVSMQDASAVAYDRRHFQPEQPLLSKAVETLTNEALLQLAKFFCLFLSAVIEAAVATIPDVQVSAGTVDKGPPTHSILSKDHSDHPLHSIAARCAQDCTRRIARAVANAWNGQSTADQVAALASSLFWHPSHPRLPQGLAMMVRERVARWTRSSDAAPSLTLLREGVWSAQSRNRYAEWIKALRRGYKEGANALEYLQYIMP